MGSMVIINGGINYGGAPTPETEPESEDLADGPELEEVADSFSLLPSLDTYARNPDFDPEIADEWLQLIRQEINRQADAVTDYEVLEDGTVIIAAVDGPRQLAIKISPDFKEISQRIVNAKELMATGRG